jgi:hypothetical protein
VTTGFNGAWYYDVPEGWYAKLPIDGELAGVLPTGADPRRFVLGRESEAARDLLFVEVEPSQPPP